VEQVFGARGLHRGKELRFAFFAAHPAVGVDVTRFVARDLESWSVNRAHGGAYDGAENQPA
jgi:hypothetical protein